MGTINFDLFPTSEDHDALREAVRAVAEAKIAPHAADVDDGRPFPAGGVRRPRRLGSSMHPTSRRSTRGPAPTHWPRAS